MIVRFMRNGVEVDRASFKEVIRVYAEKYNVQYDEVIMSEDDGKQSLQKGDHVHCDL